MYAHEHGLLNTLGWCFLQQTAKQQRFINDAINNAKRHSNPKQIRYKFGVKIPHSYAEALKFDHDNGNTLWQDSVALELKQIMDYDSFHDLGHGALTEFRQPLQVQSHLEMPGILVQLGHIQCT